MRQCKRVGPIPPIAGEASSSRSIGDTSYARAIVLVALLVVGGCSATKPPQISYDSNVPPLPASDGPVDEKPRPLHIPPAWTPTRGGKEGAVEGTDAVARVEMANDAARVEPRRDGYFNALQVFPFSPGALYQVYVAPGQITDLALEPGEQLTGSGPIAAGDTVRWIIGDTESGNGNTRRVHILIKPTRPAIETNLVINTDRRTYLIELRSHDKPYMPSIAWFYPESRDGRARTPTPVPVLPEVSQRRYRYAIEGDKPPWRPIDAYDDGRKVYIEFSPGIVQGEMPPLFVIGSEGQPELVNYRTYENVLIVDRLFAAAELRLGDKRQQKVRVVRTDGRPSP